MKSKRSKECDITQKVKQKVWQRDKGCIICGNPYAMPNAHFIPRSQGGLGIEENIVTLCIECHHDFDNGNNTQKREHIKNKIERYLKSKYKNWNKEKLIYNKWRI